jgi:hypothetical protein
VSDDSTVTLGIEIPWTSPVFLSIVAVHVLVALVCVVVGFVAMMLDKRSHRHPKVGSIYFWFVGAVFVTATVLSVMRWKENYHLFLLGLLAFGAATLGRSAARKTPRSIRLHLSSMGVSYILLLTAFYVDNGKNLPIWRDLPTLTYWLLPALLGIPVIWRTLLRHPLARR